MVEIAMVKFWRWMLRDRMEGTGPQTEKADEENLIERLIMV